VNSISQIASIPLTISISAEEIPNVLFSVPHVDLVLTSSRTAQFLPDFQYIDNLTIHDGSLPWNLTFSSAAFSVNGRSSGSES
jgi:hypothetical protein